MAVRKLEDKAQPKKMVILDSHALIHRAYHALPDFMSGKGEPTGALYGLVSILLRIIQDLKPDYIVAARDLHGPTHRHQKYEAYKATRIKADSELVFQLERAPEVYKAFGIPLYQSPGYEADDVIGTIVKKLDSEPLDVIIASGDMDTLQLASEKVCIYTMRKGVNDIALYDDNTVRERYGFGPSLVVDYKALRGDPSDNIPGVKGIGEKIATELVTTFGSIENLYKLLEKDEGALIKKGIKQRTIELLKADKDKAFFSKELATIHTNVPIEFTLPATWNFTEHVDAIVELCDAYEFRSLKQRAQAAAQKYIGSSASPSQTARVIDAAHDADYFLSQAMLQNQYTSAMPPGREIRETSIALWLLHSDTTNPSLDDIFTFAHADDFKTAQKSIFAQLDTLPALRRVFDEIEQPLIQVVDKMNKTGVCVDTAYLKTLAKEYVKELGVIAGRIYRYAGHEFNINSPKQLGVVLFDELKIGESVRARKTSGGARTTREDELVKLAEEHPVVNDVLAYRELQKLLSTYIEKLPSLVGEDGRLHAEFLQAGSTTGRMASQDPNLQNIPVKTEYGRRIRNAFVAGSGMAFLAIDYSQIELRLAAALSNDQQLVQIFRDGKDVHAATASGVFGVPIDKVDYEMRRRAKVINFGILYGMGANALRSNLGGSISRDEASNYLKNYFNTFSGLAKWIEQTKAFAAKNGYTETLYGRRRYFPGISSMLPNVRAQAERMAVNAPLQGTQADIIKLAMIKADNMIELEHLQDKVKLVLQVHDELVYEVAESEAEAFAKRLRHIMESVVDGSELNGVPIVAEASIGTHWGEMKKVGR